MHKNLQVGKFWQMLLKRVVLFGVHIKVEMNVSNRMQVLLS